MNITAERYLDINKYAVGAAILVYAIGTFVTKLLSPGIFFVFAAGFFCLLHQKYFNPRLKLAAHVWLIPVFVTIITASVPLQSTLTGTRGASWTFTVTLLICLIPCLLLATGKTEVQPAKNKRLRVISARTVVQCLVFMLYTSVTAFTFINGTKNAITFWGLFHVFTVALFPFLIGRVLCGWLCPNATFQDALFKNLKYKRPIQNLPKAIDEQSHTTAMNISGTIDTHAPYLPATLLLSWFPMFFCETVFDLTQDPWYPIYFMGGLYILSMLMPWRKLCTHFCWLSSYRGLAGQGSLWRIRYNRSKCKQCKNCQAEAACPFYIDIRNQNAEMPATCCLCFSCMEACPFDGVITFKRAPEDKARLKAENW